MKTDKAAHIRALNDRLRQTRSGGMISMTSGVNANGFRFKDAALAALAAFDAFDADNDPHDEHDFGELEVEGERLFWKIDYYDLQLSSGAEDPADEKTCTRVLTVMLTEEY